MSIYLTTPIYYVTAPPHLGHAYTTVVTDALSRHHRLRGERTRFLTGTDEHGQKVERMAAERGKEPLAFANEISAAYEAMWRRLGIANDDFIRTTDPDHEAVVQQLWTRMIEKGDIYLGHYEGWYCVACEQFYTEKEITDDKQCTVHHRPVERIKEESYFFKLKSYQDKLLAFYDHVKAETGRAFIEPEIRMNEILQFVRGGLEDLSVSRTTFKWGVKVPGAGNERHVVYVWIDALTNYYSATRRTDEARAFWPALDGGDAFALDPNAHIVHVMGKEITRFHAVYWPAMLMSAGLRLPTKIVAHGWWTVDGAKMSKTEGNVVDPTKLADALDAAAGAPVGADAFRYFVLREIPVGADGDFSHEALCNRYNAELCNDLGNLLNRTLGMVKKYFGDAFPDAGNVWELNEKAATVTTDYVAAMDAFAPSRALDAIWSFVRAANEYIERSAPWKQDDSRRGVVLWNALEACRHLAHWLSPFIPSRAQEMLRQLGRASEQPHVPQWRAGKYEVQVGTPLFPRLDDDKKKALLAEWAPRPEAPAATQQVPSEATQQSAAASQQAKPPIAYDDFTKLDLRVARIAAAERIPKKDRLLKLSIDLGAGEARTVVAGIAAAYAPEALVGKSVVFLANLKPAKIGGILSEGMILAAGDPDVLALSALDRDCPPGTRIK